MVLIKYSGKYVKIYFNMKITFPFVQFQTALAKILEEEQEGVRAVAASQDLTSPFSPSSVPRINHTLSRSFTINHGKDGNLFCFCFT